MKNKKEILDLCEQYNQVVSTLASLECEINNALLERNLYEDAYSFKYDGKPLSETGEYTIKPCGQYDTDQLHRLMTIQDELLSSGKEEVFIDDIIDDIKSREEKDD